MIELSLPAVTDHPCKYDFIFFLRIIYLYDALKHLRPVTAGNPHVCQLPMQEVASVSLLRHKAQCSPEDIKHSPGA